jgi:hypothetical protein
MAVDILDNVGHSLFIGRIKRLRIGSVGQNTKDQTQQYNEGRTADEYAFFDGPFVLEHDNLPINPPINIIVSIY